MLKLLQYSFAAGGLSLGITLGMFSGTMEGVIWGSLGGIFISYMFFKGATSFYNTFININIADADLKKVDEQFYLHHSGASRKVFIFYTVGGHLFLTKNSLLFKPHKFNLPSSPFEIKLKDIKDIRFFNPMNFFTGMEIITSEKKRIQFIVWEREQWKKEIFQGKDKMFRTEQL